MEKVKRISKALAAAAAGLTVLATAGVLTGVALTAVSVAGALFGAASIGLATWAAPANKPA